MKLVCWLGRLGRLGPTPCLRVWGKGGSTKDDAFDKYVIVMQVFCLFLHLPVKAGIHR